MCKSRLTLLLVFILLPSFFLAQTAAEIIEKYKSSIEKIENISYDVRQLDTFTTGTVWEHLGEVFLERRAEDTLFGFHYYATKDTIEREAMYDGKWEFQIFPNQKKYRLDSNPGKHILGSPGGQLVVPEIMYYQDDTIVPALVIEKDYYLLLYDFPDLNTEPGSKHSPIMDRTKKIYLDKASFLPVKIINRLVSLGKVQAITRILSNLRLNQDSHKQQIDKAFLKNYKPQINKPSKDFHKELISSKVKDFRLTTFDGNAVSLQEQEGKVLLLDFWEVWCAPCVQSMPKVQQIQEQYKDDGLIVLGIILDEKSKDSAQLLLRHKKISFLQAMGNKEILAYFKVNAIPQYVLLDKAGKIRFIYQGYDDAIEEEIKTLLDL